ncbi:MAG: tRNA (Guanine(10)-N2)-dimethyltransferase [Candidatus Thorarchaeota archaeon]|nr:MAG: tRNA (Guanine(10)-N2)-dimethyltransferase [Candidatus Thorarchaeota archaeon]
MTEYFVEITGEIPNLGKIEVRSLINIVDSSAHIEWVNLFGLISSNVRPVEFLITRSAYVRRAGRILSKASRNENPLALVDSEVISNSGAFENFCVRIDSSSNESIQIRERITKELGQKIKELSGARVDLDKPEKLFLVVMTPEEILLCDAYNSIIRPILRSQKAGKRPFFHPSMMNSFLARAMCNLAEVMPGDIVLDPFCGAGGLLCDIASIGGIPIGIDLNWRLLIGAQMNLEDQKKFEFGLIQGDSFRIPILKCDRIVTDPPYGRSSSTRGAQARQLVDTLIRQAPILLKKTGKVCIGASAEMNVGGIIEDNGYSIESQIQILVHKGLIREIFVVTI